MHLRIDKRFKKNDLRDIKRLKIKGSYGLTPARDHFQTATLGLSLTEDSTVFAR